MTGLTQVQRALVISEADTWLGTPYHHMGRIKNAGVDCAMFPLEVYIACGILPKDLPIPYYPLDWSRNMFEEKYLNIVATVADEIDELTAQPADLILFHQGRTFSHGAIILEGGAMIHSQFAVGVIKTDIASGRFLRVAKKFFTMKVA